MQPLSIPTPRKIATLTLVKRVPYTDENVRFFKENDLEEITEALIKGGFDPMDLNDRDGEFQVPMRIVEIFEQRCEWQAEGNCTLCGEYMIEDNSGDEHNPAMFTTCSNGCL